MKKTALFLSVAWIGLMASPVLSSTATDSEGQISPVPAEPDAQEKKGRFSGWSNPFSGIKNPFSRSNSAPLSGSEPMASSVSPLPAAPVLHTVIKLDSEDSNQIQAVTDALQNRIGKSSLGKFTSSTRCQTWDGYYKELMAGRDFYGSNCAKQICSVLCAPVITQRCWTAETVKEAFCAYRCSRGVNMGTGNASMKKCYDTLKEKSSTLWQSVLSYWKEKEGNSVTSENLVNANATEAEASARAIANFKAVKTAAVESESKGSLAQQKATADYTKAITAFMKAATDLLEAEEAATKLLGTKLDALKTSVQSLEGLKKSSSDVLGESKQKKIFTTARDAFLQKMKADDKKTNLTTVTVNGEEGVRLTTLAEGIAKRLSDSITAGSASVTKVEQADGTASKEADEGLMVAQPARLDDPERLFTEDDLSKLKTEVEAIAKLPKDKRRGARALLLRTHKSDPSLRSKLLAVHKTCLNEGNNACAAHALTLSREE